MKTQMPEPYYKNESVTLYCGDCLEVLPEISEKFNLLLTDPPYSRVKDDEWDRCSHSELETLLRNVFELVKPKMTLNGAAYCFCWPYFSARLQNIMSDYFNVLNEIAWMKRHSSGAHCGCQAKVDITKCRKFFPETERIVFAEMYGSDKQAADDAGYQKASVQLWTELMRPLIRYFREAKKESGLNSKEICDRMFQLTGKRDAYKHSLENIHWAFPVREQYEAAATFMPLHRQYDELRRQYDELLRAHSPNSNNFTDLWISAPIPGSSKKRLHNCQKPIQMITDMVTTSSRPGNIVLDPFAGSGTTGVAAMRTGRRAVLIERDERNCEIAANRFQQECDSLFQVK